MRNDWSRHLLAVAGFAVIYCAADLLLNFCAFDDGWTIVWPLNGITVALLLARPRRWWWSMLLGVELGTALGESFYGNPFWLELGQRIWSVSEVVLSALLLPRFRTLDEWLQTPRIHRRFVGALVLGPGLSGLGAAAMFHWTAHQNFLTAFDGWATADALGIAATLPLALSIRSPQMLALFRPPALLRSLGVLALAFAAATVIFTADRYPLGFVLYPMLLLVELRLGFAGASVAVVGILFISILRTTTGHGPFGHWPADAVIPRDLGFQIFFGFQLIALFPASVVLLERRRMAEELRGSNARLSALVSIDALTGIANRRAFDERFECDWRRALQRRTPIALAMIDLDHFKEFNDTYGHPAGDKCLRAVAETLAQHLRQPESLVARFGGEEFAVLLRDTQASEIGPVAERIRAAVQALSFEHVAGAPWRVSVSIGFAAVTPAEGDVRETLAQLADAALYQAKRLGRNRVESIASADGLEAANAQVGNSTRVRLLRLIGRPGR
ncbi:MAG: diguanylate cyclase [Steroidobacteraceae bacterium]